MSGTIGEPGSPGKDEVDPQVWFLDLFCSHIFFLFQALKEIRVFQGSLGDQGMMGDQVKSENQGQKVK